MSPAICRPALLTSLVMIQFAFVGCGGADAPTTSGPGTANNSGSSGAVVQSSPGEGWPTEEEAKATILKVEYGIRASETNKSVWKVKDLRHEVHSVKFAQKTAQKQMDYGVSATTVYPVKILYTRLTEYEDRETKRDEVGAEGIWYLYRDSVGEWKGKFGDQ